ncbi:MULTISPECIES: LysR family transcriptional regulator [Bacillus]|uniref:LysR family transcriptional regulator n=2 Tax=Bacillus TaxID=1386 RepID=A0A0M4FJ72_9BACI|nr:MULTISPECIES: LysR family transcriptional regulator [Bacillus]ALC83099.1 LysR family transcriptional regulator [Bacillus gobiensis]MBP1082154.1 DNA-binding transcriptional LysR family regulator [Bacillus capparidis]MED1096768.1 LysR family transcriptional regulator [Bacillus capparidis]
MYYDALRTFVTLVEVGNFTKTSEILHISQPSVSLHIKNLEKEFQTKLFVRSPKSVQITPTGEILYNRAKQMITMYEQTKEDILVHHNDVQGELIIGASFTIGEYILPAFLSRLQKDFPQLTLKVVIGNTNEIVQYVRMIKVDIGLIEGQTDEKEVSVHPFMEDKLSIVSSNDHPLAHQKKVTTADLHNREWVTREEGSGTREYLNHFIRSNGLKVKSILTISSSQGIKECILNGMGLSLLSNSVIEREVKSGDLSIIPLKNQTFTRTLSYVYLPIMKNKRSVETFINVLQAE